MRIPREYVATARYLAIASALFLVLYFGGRGLVGLVIYSPVVDLTANVDTSFVQEDVYFAELPSYGAIKSVSLDGSYLGPGKGLVYLEIFNQSFLILDTSNVKQAVTPANESSGGNMLTGFVVGETDVSPAEEPSEAPSESSEQEAPVASIPGEANQEEETSAPSEETTPTPEETESAAEGTIETPTTATEPPSPETPTTEETSTTSETTSTIDSGETTTTIPVTNETTTTETPTTEETSTTVLTNATSTTSDTTSTIEETGETTTTTSGGGGVIETTTTILNETTTPPTNQTSTTAETSTTILTNATTTAETSTTAETTTTVETMVISFSKACNETCTANFNASTLKLVVKIIGGGELTLGKLHYQFSKITKIVPPKFVKKIPDIIMEQNKSVSLILTDYFSGNNLSYSFDTLSNIEMKVQKGRIYFSPQKGFTGTEQTKIFAANPEGTAESNAFNVKVKSFIQEELLSRLKSVFPYLSFIEVTEADKMFTVVYEVNDTVIRIQGLENVTKLRNISVGDVGEINIG